MSSGEWFCKPFARVHLLPNFERTYIVGKVYNKPNTASWDGPLYSRLKEVPHKQKVHYEHLKYLHWVHCMYFISQSTHKVVIADFWHTSHLNGNISSGWWGWGGVGGGGARQPPFSLLPSQSCSVRSCWEGRYTSSLSSLPYIYSVLYSNGQVFFQVFFYKVCMIIHMYGRMVCISCTVWRMNIIAVLYKLLHNSGPSFFSVLYGTKNTIIVFTWQHKAQQYIEKFKICTFIRYTRKFNTEIIREIHKIRTLGLNALSLHAMSFWNVVPL